MTTSTPDRTDAQTNQLLQMFRSKWKMRYFYFKRLPSVWWWGIRIKSCTPEITEVSIPYNWRTQNPFRSIYFAALLGAAELSTGLMALLAISGRGAISMLVTNIEADFVKKADDIVTFRCDQGAAIQEIVKRAIESGEGQTAVVRSVGRLPDGTEVARVRVSWSFKKKR